jgi:DNA invertase Pin-like site-specific DNA recombinase
MSKTMLAYIRTSTGSQELGLEAQRNTIETDAGRRGWTIADWYVEQESTRNTRPVLEQVKLDVQHPDVDGLVIAKLDRVGRSLLEIATLIETASLQGWEFVCLYPTFDMTDPYGKAMAQMAGVWAELERSLIRIRTSEALQAKIARGEWVGEPPKVSAEVEQRVRELRSAGHGALTIANTLNLEGWPTVKGGPWNRGTVGRIIKRLERDDALGRTREAA